MAKSRFLHGEQIAPQALKGDLAVSELVDQTFLAYNAARLREGCHLLASKMFREDVTVGLSITGALTPAGLGMSCLIPLVKAGFVDWIVSTGANLYHDAHFGLGMSLHRGSPFADDCELKKEAVIRIYDILFDYDVLLKTDKFFYHLLRAPEFQKTMSSSEFHYILGSAMAAREEALGQEDSSLLAACYRCGVPVYTSSPGDSSIGLNIAAVQFTGCKMAFDVSADVNETTAIVYDAKKRGKKSGVWILGGGSPKNFVLQTEPQIQEIMGLEEKGHDYFLQVTDARPDTGGLSGATPGEAVSWGKIDPDHLADSIVCYLDATVALPVMTAYSLAKCAPRSLKRLYQQRNSLVERLGHDYKNMLARLHPPEDHVPIPLSTLEDPEGEKEKD